MSLSICSGARVLDDMLKTAEDAPDAAEIAQRAAMPTLADGKQAASLLEVCISDSEASADHQTTVSNSTDEHSHGAPEHQLT